MKQQFVAEDGRTFEDAEACQRYESTMDKKDVVMKWANTRYSQSRGQPTRALNIILDWEADRESINAGTFQFVEPVAEPEPAVQAAA